MKVAAAFQPAETCTRKNPRRGATHENDFTTRNAKTTKKSFFTAKYAKYANKNPGFFHHGWDRMATDTDFSHEANEENEENSSPRTMGNTRTGLAAKKRKRRKTPRRRGNAALP